MTIFSLPFLYIFWHYTTAWLDLFRLYQNFSWFLWNFFSMGILMDTLFSPWHRIREVASKDTGGLLGSVILNLMLRLVGFSIRVVTIFFGLLTLLCFSLFFLAVLLLWAVLPLIVFGLIATGLVGFITF